MKYIRTLLLFLVVVVCGGFLAYYARDIRSALETLPISRHNAQPTQRAQLLNIDINTVDRVTLIGNATDTIEASVIPIAFWKIEKPVDWAGDRRAWTRVISSIGEAPVIRSWPVSLDSLGPYGLDPAATRVIVNFRGNATPPETLDVGIITPSDQNCYVRHLPSDSVFIVQQRLKQAVAKSLMDLRDKTVLPFDRESVARIIFHRRGTRSLVLDKTGSEWMMTSPQRTLASSDSIDLLLRTVSMATAQQFHDTPGDLSQYGLDPPGAEITFVIDVAGTAIEKRLLIGHRNESSVQGINASMYVMDGSKSSVVEVDATLARHALRDNEGYRNRMLNRFDRANAHTVRITTRQGAITVVQDTTSADWFFAAPDTGQVYRPTVNRIVADVDNLRGDTFVDRPGDYGLSNPQVKVELFRGERPIAELNFGSRRGNKVYVRGMYTDQVFLVDASTIDKFTVSRDELDAAQVLQSLRQNAPGQ